MFKKKQLPPKRFGKPGSDQGPEFIPGPGKEAMTKGRGSPFAAGVAKAKKGKFNFTPRK